MNFLWQKRGQVGLALIFVGVLHYTICRIVDVRSGNYTRINELDVAILGTSWRLRVCLGRWNRYTLFPLCWWNREATEELFFRTKFGINWKECSCTNWSQFIIERILKARRKHNTNIPYIIMISRFITHFHMDLSTETKYVLSSRNNLSRTFWIRWD